MEKLGIFKIIGDELVYVGCYATREDALAYLTEIKKMIDYECQSKLIGEYVLVPMLHFDLVHPSSNLNQK
tara:strand:- start:744 stop:953 length:210 start_codon:yes stop_codon:yes gene_type:complete